MKFGAFIPPQIRVGTNPHLALERVLRLIEHLESLGFHEAWVGEHHSSGTEIVASPELMLAAAAQRTSTIRLGTGVISLPYHHPFQVAERIRLLDHLTEGRLMFGAGPGQLPTDARMIGITAADLRPRMEEALATILALLRGETVSQKTDWYVLEEAALQLAPYSESLEISVVGTVSPSGPKLAGRHGVGLMSLAATDPLGTDRLAEHWGIVTDEAAQRGLTVPREQWRLMGPMHIAETVEQAVADCEYALRWQYEYLSHITPSAIDVPDTTRELAEVLNSSGRGVIGTPEMAIAQLERLAERSGGFGTYLFQGMDVAGWSATLRSYELFAEEVMPHFTGQLEAPRASWDRVMDSTDANRAATAAARVAAAEQYERERRA